MFLVYSASCFQFALGINSCSNETRANVICFKGTKNYQSKELYPINLKTILIVKEIVKIDEKEKSITIQMILDSIWEDKGLDASNETQA